MMSNSFPRLIRVLPLAATLAATGCAAPAQPPAPPHADAARQIMDMQMAAKPTGNEPAMSGDEANVIYSRYLANIGRARGNGRSNDGAAASAPTSQGSASQ
jgi:hypothetical protein